MLDRAVGHLQSQHVLATVVPDLEDAGLQALDRALAGAPLLHRELDEEGHLQQLGQQLDSRRVGLFVKPQAGSGAPDALLLSPSQAGWRQPSHDDSFSLKTCWD